MTMPAGPDPVTQTRRDQRIRRTHVRERRTARIDELATLICEVLDRRKEVLLETETLAGEAFWEMTRELGLSMVAALQVCDQPLIRSEALRLRRLVEAPQAESQAVNGSGTHDQ